jgi:hypothetical protein
MSNAYLKIAEDILRRSRHPMRPDEILEQAYLQKLVPWHLYGSTQHKTLQARLSEDVAQLSDRSRFFRTAPGLFFLRSLKGDPNIPQVYKTEFHASPRRKELKREAILALHRATFDQYVSDPENVPIEQVKRCLKLGYYIYAHWRDRRLSKEYIPVHSFVVVHRHNEVLRYRRGKFTPYADPLRGKKTIGFGGAVLAADIDILYDSFFGIIGNGISELIYSLGMSRRLAEEVRYGNQLQPQFGSVVSQNRQTDLLNVVLTYPCPENFEPTKSSLSINDLTWIRGSNPGNDLDDYDETSALLFKRRYIEALLTHSACSSDGRDTTKVHQPG